MDALQEVGHIDLGGDGRDQQAHHGEQCAHRLPEAVGAGGQQVVAGAGIEAGDQRGDGQAGDDPAQRPECPAPVPTLGEYAAHGRAAQRGHPPHRRDQGHGAGPQAALEHQVDQRIAQGEQDAAAQALHAAPDQQQRHAGGHCAHCRTEGEHQQCQQVGDPWPTAGQQAGGKGGADDRGHHEQGGVPGIEGQPADFVDHRGQQRGDDIDIDGVQGDTAGQGDRAQRIATAEQFAPACGGLFGDGGHEGSLRDPALGV
ncbi:hypothetical protein WR25_00118 [Diploscapter pachys]|uniref:Uncharacterized protein n=1 Tax=Diploscapter pachys TaxID=2018661 RepID=A0A2A2JYV6_9BILA|nr:hypothetical protein WR25_00118 [Diploscapter pachys]